MVGSNRRRRQRGLLLVFAAAALALGIVGLGLAMYADRPSCYSKTDPGVLACDYANAAREIGGAIVAGGVLALLVVLFEELREDERIEREMRRDDEADTRALRRQMTISLVDESLGSLTEKRVALVRSLEDGRRYMARTMSPMLVPWDDREAVWVLMNRMTPRVAALFEDDLLDRWQEWTAAIEELVRFIEQEGDDPNKRLSEDEVLWLTAQVEERASSEGETFRTWIRSLMHYLTTEYDHRHDAPTGGPIGRVEP